MIEKNKELLEALKADSKEKRTGKIEKIQFYNTQEAFRKLSHKLKDCDVVWDYWNTKKKGNTYYLNRDGILSYDLGKRNVLYDTKTFDGIVYISSGNKKCTLFFIFKGTQHQGGVQDLVKREIGLYSNLIQKNKDNDCYFVFCLDGDNLKNIEDMIDESEKYIVCNSINMQKKIEELLIKKIFNYEQ